MYVGQVNFTNANRLQRDVFVSAKKQGYALTDKQIARVIYALFTEQAYLHGLSFDEMVGITCTGFDDIKYNYIS